MRKLFLCVAMLAYVPAGGQDMDKEGARPAVEAKRQREAAKAAEESAKFKAEKTPDVTFSQILDKPDDAKLNYAYALGQIAHGDLKGAATTLERILLNKPSLHRVRLLYAVILYRLDNLIEAERELKILAQQKIPEDVAAETRQYLRVVEKALRKNHLYGRLGAGFQYDTNRNATPATGRRLFLGLPVTLNPDSQRRDDTSALFMAGVDYYRAVGPHDAFITTNYYRAEQTLVKTINLQAYSAQGGTTLRSGRNALTPSLLVDHVLLAQSTYLRNHGFDVRYDRRVGKRLDAFFSVRDVYQEFVPTRQVPSANDRDGFQLDLTGGFNYGLSPKHKLGMSLNYANKHASRGFQAFERTGIIVDHTWLLGEGAFLLSNVTTNWDNYKEPDPIVSHERRADKTIRASAVLGAPLSLLYAKLESLLLTLNYEYYHAFSNLENYGYTNNKVTAMLTYKWGVGF